MGRRLFFLNCGIIFEVAIRPVAIAGAHRVEQYARLQLRRRLCRARDIGHASFDARKLSQLRLRARGHAAVESAGVNRYRRVIRVATDALLPAHHGRYGRQSQQFVRSLAVRFGR